MWDSKCDPYSFLRYVIFTTQPRIAGLGMVGTGSEVPHRADRIRVIDNPVFRLHQRLIIEEVGAEETRFNDGRPDAEWLQFERQHLGADIEIEIDGPLALADQDLMVDAALAGAGLAYVFEGMAERHIAAGRLTRVPEDWCPYYPGFFLYYPSRRHIPVALRAFIDFSKAIHIASDG